MSELRRYPDYKDSGVPWLGEIPSHWEVIDNKFGGVSKSMLIKT